MPTATGLVLSEHELMLILDDIFTSNDREELMEAVLKHVSFPRTGAPRCPFLEDSTSIK